MTPSAGTLNSQSLFVLGAVSYRLKLELAVSNMDDYYICIGHYKFLQYGRRGTRFFGSFVLAPILNCTWCNRFVLYHQ